MYLAKAINSSIFQFQPDKPLHCICLNSTNLQGSTYVSSYDEPSPEAHSLPNPFFCPLPKYWQPDSHITSFDHTLS